MSDIRLLNGNATGDAGENRGQTPDKKISLSVKLADQGNNSELKDQAASQSPTNRPGCTCGGIYCSPCTPADQTLYWPTYDTHDGGFVQRWYWHNAHLSVADHGPFVSQAEAETDYRAVRAFADLTAEVAKLDQALGHPLLRAMTEADRQSAINRIGGLSLLEDLRRSAVTRMAGAGLAMLSGEMSPTDRQALAAAGLGLGPRVAGGLVIGGGK